MTSQVPATSSSLSHFTTDFDRNLLKTQNIPSHGETLNVKWMIFPPPVRYV